MTLPSRPDETRGVRHGEARRSREALTKNASQENYSTGHNNQTSIYTEDFKENDRTTNAKKPVNYPPGLVLGYETLQPSSAGLGALASSEGVLTRRDGVEYEAVKCTCGRENEKCFRCDGTGYYERRLVLATSTSSGHSQVNARPEAGLSNDSRGGAYGIREHGRFDSSPLEDDYDN